MDYLLAQQITCISVLDVSAAALARAQARIGLRSQDVTWIEADVTGEWTATRSDTFEHGWLPNVDPDARVDAHAGMTRRKSADALDE